MLPHAGVGQGTQNQKTYFSGKQMQLWMEMPLEHFPCCIKKEQTHPKAIFITENL